MDSNQEQAGLAWQTGVWNRMSDVYVREIDHRFAPVVEQVIARAQLAVGERVLDLGTGTGAVAVRAAHLVGPEGLVVGVDISADMLRAARQRVAAQGLTGVSFREGRAEALPAENESFDVVLASLSLMYVIDRAAAARLMPPQPFPDGGGERQHHPHRSPAEAPEAVRHVLSLPDEPRRHVPGRFPRHVHVRGEPGLRLRRRRSSAGLGAGRLHLDRAIARGRAAALGTSGQRAWPGYEHVHLELQRGADPKDLHDPVPRIVGCFDATARYPPDRLALTYPVPC